MATPLFLADGDRGSAGCRPVVASASVAAYELILGLAALNVLVGTLSASVSLLPALLIVARLSFVVAVGVSLLLHVRTDLLSSDGHPLAHRIGRLLCTLRTDFAVGWFR